MNVSLSRSLGQPPSRFAPSGLATKFSSSSRLRPAYPPLPLPLGPAQDASAGSRAQIEPPRHVASLQDIRQRTRASVAGPVRNTERQGLGRPTHTRVLPTLQQRHQSPVRPPTTG